MEYFQQQADEESSLQKRIADFKKALSHNEVLEEFDRGIFESIIEKVIVGGYDENGEKDPYKITFIYKTGFKNEIGNAKERFDKSKSVGDKAKELCSHITDEMKDVCSYVSDITLGADGIYYPNLVSTDEEPHYGKYGMIRKTYLKEHRPAMYSLYMLEDRLTEHLNTVDDEAQERMDILVRQMMERQGITEELKARDQMEWVRLVNGIRNMAEEIVLKELVYI